VARQRFIHPELWSDPTVGQLTPTERLFFIGCFSNADDEGRLLGSPAYLRSVIFPYDDFTIEQVKQIRDQVTCICKNLILYEFKSLEYLAFKKWSQYQKPKYPKPSKFPEPYLPDEETILEKSLPEIGESMEKGLLPRLGRVRDGFGSRLGMGRVGDDETNQPGESLEELNQNVTETERAILKELKTVTDYPFDYEKDLGHIRALAIDFPEIDLVEQLKKWRTYKIDKPLNKNSNARLQFRNWCEIAEKQRLEKGDSRHEPKARGPTTNWGSTKTDNGTNWDNFYAPGAGPPKV
jgi:hypothetical protein